jgi:hypothetical protein
MLSNERGSDGNSYGECGGENDNDEHGSNCTGKRRDENDM